MKLTNNCKRRNDETLDAKIDWKNVVKSRKGRKI